jgi:sugar transferase (PEP-CTERM/EpsH1 system associated)
MRLLVLDEYLSWPIDSGKKVRTFNILQQLSHDHQIMLLTYVWGDPNEAAGLEKFRELGIEVTTVRRHDPRKSGLSFYFRLFRNLFSRLPYIVDGHLSDAYTAQVRRLVDEWQPDVVMAEWSPYSIFVEDLDALPRVAVAHNLESSIWRGYVEKARSPLKRAYLNLQYRKVKKFEREIFGWLEGLITVSPLELESVRKEFPDLRSALVDNGVDTEFFAPSAEREDDKLISFCGSMDWRPNQDGVEHFITDILPILRQRIPDVRVLMIGREPPEWLVELGKQHKVEFTGSVDDVRPMVCNSAVSIVPLRIGGGSRLKILEAFSMGKAVVSTSLGAEGLRLTHGEHLLVADQPEQFADAVADLLNDSDRRRQLGQDGRQLVLERYRWQEIAKVQSRFLEGFTRASGAGQ